MPFIFFSTSLLLSSSSALVFVDDYFLVFCLFDSNREKNKRGEINVVEWFGARRIEGKEEMSAKSLRLRLSVWPFREREGERSVGQ